MKYFATLGPKFFEVEDLVHAKNLGLTGIRINLSHSNLKSRKDWLDNIKKADQITGRKTEILLDIVGAEIRIKVNRDISLEKDDFVILSKSEKTNLDNTINLDEKVLKSIELSDIIHIDDGKAVLKVIQAFEYSFKAKALKSCIIKNNKSFSILNKTVDMPVVSKDDIDNFIYSKEYDIKSFMLPFVRSKEDVIYLRKVLDELDIDNYIIYSKIEDIIGYENIEEICKYSDEIVIARGDLGNNVGLLKVIKLQKEISKICNKLKKPFMVVTQLLNSMIEKPTPTRAEINDIYNSCLDGATSLMVTGETAVGNFPLETIKYLIKASKIEEEINV